MHAPTCRSEQSADWKLSEGRALACLLSRVFLALSAVPYSQQARNQHLLDA